VSAGTDFTADLAALFVDGPSEPADPPGDDGGLETLDEQTQAAYARVSPREARPWRATARETQAAVADTRSIYTLYLAGRGTGKTHTASHALAEWIEQEPGDYMIAAPTFSDCRQVCVEGPSGFLKAAADEIASYDKSKFEILMKNGSHVFMASDDAPERFRGKNLTGVWADEVGSWRNVKTSWDAGIEFATRIGSSKRLITATPRRGNPIIKELHDRAVAGDPNVTMIRDSTMANAANLSAAFLETVQRRYEGTTLGRQELYGELLNEVPGALLSDEKITAVRCKGIEVPELSGVVIGVDPAVSASETSDHTGICVMGMGGPPTGWVPPRPVLASAPHLYVLQDASIRDTTENWARRVLDRADYWGADEVIAEVNQGGGLVESTLRLLAQVEGRGIPPYRAVTASRAKIARAEPVAALVEQGRLHFVGRFPELEAELCEWVPGTTTKSPDRMDSWVWAACGLMPELAIKAGTPLSVVAAG
jgi:phage terminase large subunit-like protein